MNNNKLQVSRPKSVRKKISESLKERNHKQGGMTEHTRQKISETMAKRWKERKQELENKKLPNDELNGK